MYNKDLLANKFEKIIFEVMNKRIKIAVLTISTRGSKGERKEDTSGETIKEMVKQLHSKIVFYKIIPDDKTEIIRQMRQISESGSADLILTTGGTGLSPSDVTPEATLDVIDRRVPGIEEVMRRIGFEKTPHALLSRAVSGIYKKTLIVNLPGSPNGVRENLDVILDVIPHCIKVLKGSTIEDNEHIYKNNK